MTHSIDFCDLITYVKPIALFSWDSALLLRIMGPITILTLAIPYPQISEILDGGAKFRILYLFSVKVYHGFLTLCVLSIFSFDGGAGIGILTPVEHLVWIPLEVFSKRGRLCDLLKSEKKVRREPYGCYSNFGSEQ